MNPKLIVEQKITFFVNKYAIYEATSDGKKGTMLALAQQKRFNIKEKIIFYTDKTKSQVAFTFRTEKVLDIHGKYFVEDAQGQLVGMFKKQFGKSLLSSTWQVMGKNEEVLLDVYESSRLLAIIRRFGGFVPYLGDLIDIIVRFFRYHFVFADAKTKQPVGKYVKTTLFRDHYRLDMSDDAYGQLDWRVLAAMAVGLDALQSR